MLTTFSFRGSKSKPINQTFSQHSVQTPINTHTQIHLQRMSIEEDAFTLTAVTLLEINHLLYCGLLAGIPTQLLI